MKNDLVLIVALYLAKFDTAAYEHLSELFRCKRAKGAIKGAIHERIGARLHVKPNTVKNMRDEFDPCFKNRIGWHQKPMAPSRKFIYGMYGDSSYSYLRNVADNILRSDHVDFIEIVDQDEDLNGDFVFSCRGQTGAKAEEFFMHEHKKKGKPMPGKLTDTRLDGCGYDFEIASADSKCYVEVKGLKEGKGTLLCTAKEWKMARRHQDSYYFAIVKNVHNEKRAIEFIRNPASIYSPKTRLHKVVSGNFILRFDGYSQPL